MGTPLGREPLIFRSQALHSHSITAPQSSCENAEKYTKVICTLLRVVIPCTFKSCRVRWDHRLLQLMITSSLYGVMEKVELLTNLDTT